MSAAAINAKVEERRAHIRVAAMKYRDALAAQQDARNAYRALAVRDAQHAHPTRPDSADTVEAAQSVMSAEAVAKRASTEFYALIDSCPVARWQLLEKYK